MSQYFSLLINTDIGLLMPCWAYSRLEGRLFPLQWESLLSGDFSCCQLSVNFQKDLEYPAALLKNNTSSLQPGVLPGCLHWIIGNTDAAKAAGGCRRILTVIMKLI
ncbi:hypothetical protein [Bacillus marinisedimentorum]|uniref:hypothetical protein n=1 Tax=Bacillus marinisedimentorum TaxID=1821260 RepID=UPI0012FF9A06|nr:hypothetical protein [Bacillus marinisedimentorum]